MRNWKTFAALLLAGLILNSCGGSGGGGEAPAVGHATWDQATWGTATWR